MIQADVKEMKEMLTAKSESESSRAKDVGRLRGEVGWVSAVCKVCSCLRSYTDLAGPKEQQWLRRSNSGSESSTRARVAATRRTGKLLQV